jgi:hypothetical protein
MDAEKLTSGLGELGQIFRRNIKSPGCESFIDRNIDAADPGVVHADVRDQIASVIDYRDVHRLLDLFGLFFRCGDHSPCVR